MTPAGVRIAPAHTLEELAAAIAVIDAIWRPPPEAPEITLPLLRALTHAGNPCTLAHVDGVAAPVGVCLGFRGAGRTLHSHIAGVLPAHAGRGIGRALKLDQRAWALAEGLDAIEWTYDPLIRRNALFNLRALGALPTRYLVDFYGAMPDALNAGQGSDRLLVRWDLRTPPPVAAADADTAPVALAVGAGQEPVPGPADGDAVRVALPEDVEALRRADPELGRRWRAAVREALGGRLETGWRVTGVTHDGAYAVAR